MRETRQVPDSEGTAPHRPFTPSLDEVRAEANGAEWRHDVERYRARLADARTLLLMQHHFYGRLAMRLEFAITEAVATAAVRADAVCYVNPHFIDRLGISELAFVVAHEVGHLMLGHFDRIGWRNPTSWNVACDLVLNPLLTESGLVPPKERETAPIHAAVASDRSVEQVYEWIAAEMQKGRGYIDLLDEPDGRGGYGTPKGDCDFAATPRLRAMGGERRIPTPREWRDAMVEAAAAARSIGQMPVGAERLIDALVAPRLPWSVILSRLTRTTLNVGTEWRRPSRRSPSVRARVLRNTGARTALPGPRRAPEPVAIAIDTSGSMGSDELTRALSEATGILRVYQRPIRVLCCDSAVHTDEDVRNVRRIEVRGGGGTSCEPVLARLRESGSGWKRPAMLIYFSDMLMDIPTSGPPFPVIWVQTWGSEPVDTPWGRVILYSV